MLRLWIHSSLYALGKLRMPKNWRFVVKYVHKILWLPNILTCCIISQQPHFTNAMNKSLYWEWWYSIENKHQTNVNWKHVPAEKVIQKSLCLRISKSYHFENRIFLTSCALGEKKNFWKLVMLDTGTTLMCF